MASASSEPPAYRLRMAVLFGVVFVDLLGLGILMPLIPFYGVRLGISTSWLTLVISLHALFQFVGAAALGRWSDRVGRRPVLMLSMAGHASAYLLLAFSDSIWVLIGSRILSGFTSGNLSAAYAYVSDIAPAKERTRLLARISAAFALGLTFGPLLGGVLAGPGDPASANLVAPAFAAATLSTISLISIYFWLPETRDHVREPNTNSASPLIVTDSTPFVWWSERWVQVILILAWWVIAFSAMRETLFALWLFDKFAADSRDIGLLIGFHGLLIAIMQLQVTGRLANRWGESTLVGVGVLAFAGSWWALASSHSITGVWGAMTISAFATALFMTSLQSLLAERAPQNQRGMLLGTLQSSTSLARFMGGAISGLIYAGWGLDAPFLLAALAMAPALVLAWQLRGQILALPVRS
jgi:MFS family permease